MAKDGHPGRRFEAWRKRRGWNRARAAVEIRVAPMTYKAMMESGTSQHAIAVCRIEMLTRGTEDEIRACEWVPECMGEGLPPPVVMPLDRSPRGEGESERTSKQTDSKPPREKSTTGRRPTLRRE